MEIRQFRAHSLHAALERVREELGPEAMVLDSRKVWDGWWSGIWGGRLVEVTATEAPEAFAEYAEASGSAGPRNSEARGAARHPLARVEDAGREAEGPMLAFQPPPAHAEDFRARFRNSLVARERTHGIPSPLPSPPSNPVTSGHHHDTLTFRLFASMVESEFDEATAREIATRVRPELPDRLATSTRDEDWDVVRERLIAHLTHSLPIQSGISWQPGTQSVVAFVGPTGVGKTTTVAKLAANFRLRAKARVGLITLDTFRIAAAEQLRTYADILDVPMEVVTSQRELREALDRFQDLELLLVDTAGRSPQDELQVRELRAMLATAAPREIHLVLSATSGTAYLQRAAQQFAVVQPSALLLTKLDEIGRLGSIYNFLKSQPLRLSYLTHGQNVPDDIQIASHERLGKWLVPEHQPVHLRSDAEPARTLSRAM